jgi:uncharacterized protein (DUF2126 family)
VSTPAGAATTSLPVNAFEAEARRVTTLNRIAEFVAEGSTLGPMSPPQEEPTAEYPYTLDLRRQPE